MSATTSVEIKPVPELHDSDDRDKNWRRRSKKALKNRKGKRRKRPQYNTPTLDNTPHMAGYATIEESQNDPNGTIIWSYGGGKNSTAGIISNLKKGLRIDRIVFADTGNEKPETMAFLPVFQRLFLDKYDLKIETVRNRKWKSLSENCMEKKIIPRASLRWCTHDFKREPILRVARKVRKETKGTVYQYLGIGYEERAYRSFISEDVWNPVVFPLIEEKHDRQRCVDIIAAEGLPIPVKSGCTFCMFQPLSDWRKLYLEHPDKFAEAMAMEENEGNGHALIPKERGRYVYLRDLKKRFDNKQNDMDIIKYFEKEHGVDLSVLENAETVSCGIGGCHS